MRVRQDDRESVGCVGEDWRSVLYCTDDVIVGVGCRWAGLYFRSRPFQRLTHPLSKMILYLGKTLERASAYRVN